MLIRVLLAIPVLVVFLLCASPAGAGPINYDLTFSTYFGGSDYEHARDVFVDDSGAGWPAVNAYQGAFNGGANDVIIARLEVPEPGALAILALGLCAITRRRTGVPPAFARA